MGDTGQQKRALDRMSLSLRRPSWQDDHHPLQEQSGSRAGGILSEQYLKSDAELLQALVGEPLLAAKRESTSKVDIAPVEGSSGESRRPNERATSDSGNTTSPTKSLLNQHLSSQLEERLKLAPILARRLEGSSASGSFSSKVRTLLGTFPCSKTAELVLLQHLDPLVAA